MLNDKAIQQALHASRVVALHVANPHGPFGLEQLAEAAARVKGPSAHSTPGGMMRRQIALSTETWQKLDDLAKSAAQTSAHPISASDVAAAILEQTVMRP